MLKSKLSEKYIDSFLKKCMENVKLINKMKGDDKSIKTVFTIASTTAKGDCLLPYVTPIRFNRYCIITGSVVFNQTHAILVAKLLDGLVDIIAADAEKKVPILSIPDKQLLPKDVLEALGGWTSW